MDVLFVAGFAVITTDVTSDRRLFVESLGLPLQPPVSVPDSDYVSSDDVPGARHLGVWPLAEAAQSCFGQDTWPATHPVPQATIEFEVADDVEDAAQELADRGHRLVHPARTEPWQQVIARLQTADGLLVGVCHTPWMHDG